MIIITYVYISFFIFISQAFQLPKNEIKIAKEFGFNIKVEPADDELWCSFESIRKCSSCHAKDSFIQDIEREQKNIKASHLEEVNKLQMEIDRLTEERNKLAKQLECYKTGRFDVDSIHGVKMVKKKRWLLVKWKDFPDDSWTPEEDLNCHSLIENYLKKK